MRYADIENALAGSGLMCRGGFHPRPEDGVPEPSGPVATVVMVGNAGPDMWRTFSAAVDAKRRANDANPLDAWTEATLRATAAELGADVAFPFGGPPYHPFQRWAMRAEGIEASPIGPLIHPTFGMWHAYRGAVLFGQRVALPVAAEEPNPCRSCADKPCLAACPANAFSNGTYDVPACTDHLASSAETACMETGCLARRACPIGHDYVYEPDQIAFHMDRFLRAYGPAAS